MMAKETDIPVGHISRCIYNSDHPGPFTDEHILADGLGGEFMLTNASCISCQRKINIQIEQPVMMRMMKAIRYRRDIGTRGIDRRPSSLPVFKPREMDNTASENLSDIADWERIDLPRKEHPSLLVLPVLGQPGLLRDFAPPSTKPWFQGMWQHIEPSPHRGTDEVPIKTETKFNVEVFCRLIAKTAHCAAVQKFGLDGFTPFLAAVQAKARGGAMNNVSLEDIQNVILPLPPLAEQHRIVAKVNELMALCDQLEVTRTAQEAKRDRLTAASLTRLSTPDPETFQSAARFALDTLPALTTRRDQIKQLRQTILNLATRGKLVRQDSQDEPVLTDLRRIKASGTAIGIFQLPSSWLWVTVGAVADTRLGKMLDKAKNRGTPRPYLRNINVRWFGFNLSDLLEMPFEDHELEEFALRPGDVLICEGGEPGRAAVWRGEAEGIYFQKAIHRVRFRGLVDPVFFVNAIRASAGDGCLAESFTGTGIKHFTGKGLDAYCFPLPPLAEQRRIVAKVDELMALCDQLEASLTTATTTRSRLLEATLHEALRAPQVPVLEAAE